MKTRESAVLQTVRDSYRETPAIAISDDGRISDSDGPITVYGITWKCLESGELEAGKTKFDEAGIEIPFDQLDVHIRNEK